MNRFVKVLFFALVVKPFVLIVIGLNVRGRDNFPKTEGCVVIANHNSHLDTLVLMSLFPLNRIHKIRPVAAADYFLEQGGFKAWFASVCIGILALDRKGNTDKNALFDECHKALDNGDTLILFPEGSRGSPEEFSELKKGIYYLVEQHAHIKVIPVLMHGLGKAMPKGSKIPVPFNCDCIIGEALPTSHSADEFLDNVIVSFTDLSEHCLTRDKSKDLEFNQPDIKLNTERLTIRRIKLADKQDVAHYVTNPDIARYLPEGALDEQKMDELLEQEANGTPTTYAVELKGSGKVVGHMIFHPCFNEYTFEIGWVIHCDHQRNGYAFEAAQALIDYGFSKGNVHRVIATCQPQNTSSYRLMEKLGMRREGHFKECVHREDGEWWDEYLYAILKTEL
ncbi:hypothetical protein GCM10007932_17040 [Vibrio penaeicida]|uniref:N-acetyltransferase domain-containing protein n=1 Tax=Vibrio penaeicida TaxID=104609 RepID=A0AAV5NPS6_9VIBR|nr:hypothetical protein GCM10007932_17040 [Vibrio penaeicida]